MASRVAHGSQRWHGSVSLRRWVTCKQNRTGATGSLPGATGNMAPVSRFVLQHEPTALRSRCSRRLAHSLTATLCLIQASTTAFSKSAAPHTPAPEFPLTVAPQLLGPSPPA